MVSVLGSLSICDCRYTCEDGVYTYEGNMLLEYVSEDATGGAFYVQQGSVLNLYGGDIYSTGVFNRGGLIYTTSNSTTNIYNAILHGPKTTYPGGGIYIYNGDVNIYGGVITGCNSSRPGNGIYMKNGTLTISGSPQITRNKKNDVCLAEGQTITIGEGGLKPGAKIGIMLDTQTGVFTTNATAEDAQYFTAASGKTIFFDSEAGELSIAEADG